MTKTIYLICANDSIEEAYMDEATAEARKPFVKERMDKLYGKEVESMYIFMNVRFMIGMNTSKNL